METLLSATYFFNEMKNAGEILDCLNECKTPTGDEFGYRNSYYTIRHQLLGFLKISETARVEVEGLRAQIEESDTLPHDKALVDTFNESEKLFMQVKERRIAALETHITRECSEYFDEVTNIVPWENHIVFDPEVEFRVEILDQLDYIRNDLKLTKGILKCLHTHIGRPPSINSRYMGFTLEACHGSLESLVKCRDKLVDLIKLGQETLEELRFMELLQETESVMEDIEEVYELHHNLKKALSGGNKVVMKAEYE